MVATKSGQVKMFGMKEPVQVEVAALEAKAEAIADVLDAHKVFGETGGDYSSYEKRDFVSSVVRHVAEEGIRSYLELTYRSSCVRLIIHMKLVAGEVQFREVNAYDHPTKNSRMDYEALNVAIQEELAK